MYEMSKKIVNKNSNIYILPEPQTVALFAIKVFAEAKNERVLR